MNDTISRQAAIDALKEPPKVPDTWSDESAIGEREQWEKDVKALNSLPPAQPEISRIEQKLRGKTPEEQYEFLYWLLFEFALTYTDSRLAVIEWLRGNKDNE